MERVLCFEYEIDLNTRGLEVDNAVLQNNMYFNLEFNGHFSDYLSRIPRQGDFPKFQSYKDNLNINFYNGFSCFGALAFPLYFLIKYVCILQVWGNLRKQIKCGSPGTG